MFELQGKYAKAKIFTDLTDNESISQVMTMLNQPFAEGQTIRMMPDIHAGAGCTVGTTMTVTDKACPNLVGVDIGCGMHAVMLEETEIDFQSLDDAIRAHVPSGFAIRGDLSKEAETLYDQCCLEKLRCAKSCDLDKAYHSIGSLGGGNHFIEVDKAKDGRLWLVVHSGSRHLGLEVANFYQKLAVKELHSASKDAQKEVIARLKAEGRQRDIPQALKDLRPPYMGVPDALCWCEGQSFEDYVHDLKIAQYMADLNRRAIAGAILECMGLHAVDSFTTIHNYLDTDQMILRKGAVSAKKGERLLIPMNMRDGSLICIGKGNPDWNFSAPHGAGRLMSRAAAKASIDMTAFKDSMEGIWTTSVSYSTIDESPMAYKPMQSIVENIVETVDIVDVIKPVYNFKAGD